MEKLKKVSISTSNIDTLSIHNVYEITENSWNWMFKSLINPEKEHSFIIDLINKKEIINFKTEESYKLESESDLTMLTIVIYCKHKNGKFVSYVINNCIKTEYIGEDNKMFVAKAIDDLNKDTGECTLLKTYIDLNDIIRINCSSFIKYPFDFKEED